MNTYWQQYWNVKNSWVKMCTVNQMRRPSGSESMWQWKYTCDLLLCCIGCFLACHQEIKCQMQKSFMISIITTEQVWFFSHSYIVTENSFDSLAWCNSFHIFYDVCQFQNNVSVMNTNRGVHLYLILALGNRWSALRQGNKPHYPLYRTPGNINKK
jgi:hypothetical protein